jgi:biotin carboxylase
VEFTQACGFPVVVKPPSGAGARNTFRVDGTEALGELLARLPPSAEQPMLVEEFLTGEEHSFDTISLRGKHLWHSLTRYHPSPLEVLENPWIQWCVLLPREVNDPGYDDVRRVAVRALDALEMDTGLSHTEWFRRPDGSVAISEVAARPPGAQFTSLISYAHDIDFYRLWAKLVVHHTFDPPRQRFAAGTAFLRGQGSGPVKAIHGLSRAQRELGELVVEAKLPEPGQSPAGGYEGEGYVILRHPETAVVAEGLRRLVSTVRVELSG